ncbi:MAG TPA: hypothetical protein VNQ99_04790 [Xanthobacteraceae bacterium]|nr:hypothetical protein [Xanthobacteraceae bacterium]
MSQPEPVSRRWAIFRLGRAAASAAALSTATVPAMAAKDKGGFEHPSEYVSAMQEAGMRIVAGFIRRSDGTIQPFGVYEYYTEDAWTDENFRRRNAIDMRMPIQKAADMPQGEWWDDVWQYLYDKGLREDGTASVRQISGKDEA